MASRRLFDGAQIELGILPIVGASTNPGVALTATEAADTASFTVGIVGANPTVSLTATEGSDVAAFTVAGRARVTLTATEAPDTAAFTVRNRARVTLGATETPDVAAFATSVVSATPAVSLTATEGSDVAAFAVRGPALAPTGGGAGDYFTNVPNFARRWVDIREELEEKPTPELVREAARAIVQSEPDIEPDALQELISQQLQAYDMISSLLAIAQEEARMELQRLQMLEQDEEEIQQAIRMFASYLQ
jgi:hypothetical protein